MTRTIPIVPTIVVVAAVLLMGRLGIWQLHRLDEKRALLAHYAVNADRPPSPLVALFPVTDAALYRRTSAMCLSVAGWTAEAGRAATGAGGWRHIASCRSGAEGPGFAVDMGVSQSSAPPRWSGGAVRGRMTWTPTAAPLIARMIAGPPPALPMIVSDRPAPGLAPSAQPDPAGVPNNHLAYTVQWFLFAGVALAVYAAALWQRARKARLP